MYAPEKVVRELFLCRYFERCDIAAERIERAHDSLDRTIFAACVSPLQDDEDAAIAGAIEQFLKMRQFFIELLQFLFTLLAGEFLVVIGVEITELDRVIACDLVCVGHIGMWNAECGMRNADYLWQLHFASGNSHFANHIPHSAFNYATPFFLNQSSNRFHPSVAASLLYVGR